MMKVYDGLHEVRDPEERNRISTFVLHFKEKFNTKPAYVIRSPGRINLIGDHIDYHGFSVLPMAIEKSILLGYGLLTRDGDHAKMETPSIQNGGTLCAHDKRILIKNMEPQSYPDAEASQSLVHGAHLDRSHKWHHYVMCGYHGVIAKELLRVPLESILTHAKNIVPGVMPEPDSECHQDTTVFRPECDEVLDRLRGDMCVLVDSYLPPAAGLSSSSALVCASAVATKLHLHENQVEREHLQPAINSQSVAEDCAYFEHLVGTHGGGMDQAVIMTAQEGYAKFVEFRPKFRCSNVRLPGGVVWLVSHSGISYAKAATSGFNCRVLETKLAAALIVRSLRPASELELDHTLTLGRVRDELFADMSASDICRLLSEQVFREGLTSGECKLDEICLRLDVDRAELARRFKTSVEFMVENGLDERVSLLRRTEHVLEEADRVVRFKQICDTTHDIGLLGKLMSESHASLRHKYECSHPKLDELVEESIKAGALGARLTGAGWGGCVVTLVEADKCDAVMRRLASRSKFTFRTEPQSGSEIIRVSE